MTQTETQLGLNSQELIELTIYHFVNRDFEMDNIYAMGGNAKHIAGRYDCHLEFKHSQFREIGLMSFFPSYLERCGIGREGSCISAVLVGEDREKLAKARDNIQRIFGVPEYPGCIIDVGHEKLFWCK